MGTAMSMRMGGDGGMSSLARAEAESVSWLFPPPNHLSFPGSFAEVIDACTLTILFVYVYVYVVYFE